MSRTRRTNLEWRTLVHGRYWTFDEEWDYALASGWRTLGWQSMPFINGRCRDEKPRGKPPKWFKKMNRRWERNLVNQAVRQGKEPPRFRKYDQWEWD